MKQWVNLSACITLKLLVTDSTLFHNTVGMLHSLEHVCVCAILLPATAVAEGEAIIQEALLQADNPHHTAVTCTAGTWLDAYFMCVYISFFILAIV